MTMAKSMIDALEQHMEREDEEAYELEVAPTTPTKMHESRTQQRPAQRVSSTA